MGAYLFALGTRFRWQQAAYEVTRVLAPGSVQIEDVATSATRQAPVAELVAALFRGDLQIDRHPATLATRPPSAGERLSLDLSDYPPNQVAIARYRLACLQPLLDLPPERRARADVKARAQEVMAAGTGPRRSALGQAVSAASLYRWLAAYQASGHDLRALIPGTTERGGRGRPRLAAELNAIIEQTINDLFKVREQVSTDDLLHEVAVRVEENNRLRPPAEQLRLPSRATLKRRVNRLDLRDRLVTKHGARAARRQLKQHDRTAFPQLPLEQVEIDHTKADLIVVDEADDLPLGRFTVTYCLDLCTRYPLGFYLGFEPPGYYPVMECLYHAIAPKENYPETHGTAHPWLACGIPSVLKVDNGKDFISQSLDDACLALGMVLNRGPVRTPEFKAGLERYFGTLNTMLLHQLPGTTFSNPRQRGDYDSAGQACVYLSEVERMMIRYVVDIYAERPHRGLAGGIPARRWEAAWRSGLSPRVPASREELLILLGRVTSRSVQTYGIEFEHLRYNTPALATLRHRLKGQHAKIKYHPGDLSRVYVFDPFENEYLEVPACDPDGYTQNLSLWKHKVIRAYALNQSEKPDLAALGRAKRAIRDIVKAAKQHKKQRTRAKIARWESTPPSQRGQAGPAALTPPEAPAATSEPSSPANRVQLDLPAAPEAEGWAVTYDRPGTARGTLTDTLHRKG
jgi:putative transposase